MKPVLFFCICLLATFTACSQAGNIPAIPGWNRMDANAAYHFFPAGGNTRLDYYVMPVSKDLGAAGLESWIKQQGQKDIQNASWTEPKTGVSQTQQGISSYVTTINDAGKNTFIAMYVAYLRADKATRWAKIIYPVNNFSRADIGTAVAHFMALAKNEMGGNAFASNNTPPANTSGENSPAYNGAGASAIKGVVLHRETMTGLGGIAYAVYRPYLLFNDGSFYGWLDTDPYAINAVASHREQPKKWGTWTLNGKTLSIRWNSEQKNNEWTAAWWQWATPAAKGDRMSGSFTAISGVGSAGGGAYAMSSKNITFNSSGQFTFQSVGGGGYSGVGGSNSAWSSHDGAGTYALDGYSIMFRYNNGRVVSNSFYFYDDKKDMFGIGTGIYTKDE